MNRNIILVTISLCLAGFVSAQEPVEEPQPSLAEVARRTREQTKSGKAKLVVTDDTIAAGKSPIPELRLDAADNSKEIIASIDRFSATHTPQQTEAAVREWFDNEDSQLAYEISQMGQSSSILTSYYELQDRPATTYKQTQERRLAEVRSFEVKRLSEAESAARRSRFQTRLANVRSGIRTMGLKYDWFKIRCLSNSDCSY